MSGWSCPHQTGDYFCQRVRRDCVPGMKGCVLRGKVRFAKDEESDSSESIKSKTGKPKDQTGPLFPFSLS